MLAKLKYKYTDNWLDDLRSQGRYSFTLKEAKSQFLVSEQALKSSLYRLRKQGKIVSVLKGFYVIVPPEYKATGMLPPLLFVDELMKYVQHRYYVGLLSAAAQYGAAHHAPQTFFVVTELPVLRGVRKKGIHIRFVHTRDFPETGIRTLKTTSGFVPFSTPELTAIDLIKFEKSIGRLQRSVEVLSELQEEIIPEKMKDILEYYPTTAAIQRLGYICEAILENKTLAGAVWYTLKKRSFRYVRLINGIPGDVFARSAKWKVGINYELSTEL